MYQYTRSKQDYGSLKMPDFMDGYKQAVLDFKAILKEQEGKGCKFLKNYLDSPFYIEEVHLAFKDDGLRNFDGIWCWCTD